VVVVALLAAAPARAGFVSSSIQGTFNSTAIPAGDYVWFNSSLTTSSLVPPSTPFTVWVRGGSIQFTSNGTTYNLPVPDANITFNASSTSTTFGSGTWNTLDWTHANNTFVAGVAFQVPAGGLPGGVGPVTWTASFATSLNGLNFHWDWGAAVYSQFSTNYTNLGVRPISDSGGTAGTPANYTSYLAAGGTGSGGTNYTGTYMTAAAVGPLQASTVPAPPSLALVLGGLLPVLAWARRRR
jgi:hypothetical protein